MPAEDIPTRRPDLKKAEKVEAELKEKGIYNYPDFISVDTYKSIFDRFDLKNKKILNIGAGFPPISDHSSDYTSALPSQDLTFVPLDKSLLGLRVWDLNNPMAEEHIKGESVVTPAMGDFFHMPFKDESFDGGLSINVLNAFSKKGGIKPFLVEAYRVLKPGGFIILSSFGYSRMEANSVVTYNNEFEEEDIVDSSFIEDNARELGFSTIERVPLDLDKLKSFIKKSQKNLGTINGGKIDFSMVAPFGLLLIK